MSSRELTLAWMTGVVVLLVLTFLLGRGYLSGWRDDRAKERKLISDIDLAERAIEQRPGWNKQRNDLMSNLRALPADKKPGTILTETISTIARKNNVTWTQLEDKPEERLANPMMYKLDVECTWKANTKGLIDFLYDLQDHEVMFDVRKISIDTSGKDDLRGNRMIIQCVYTKQESEPAAAPPAPVAPGPPAPGGRGRGGN